MSANKSIVIVINRQFVFNLYFDGVMSSFDIKLAQDSHGNKQITWHQHAPEGSPKDLLLST